MLNFIEKYTFNLLDKHTFGSPNEPAIKLEFLVNSDYSKHVLHLVVLKNLSVSGDHRE